MMLGHVGAVRQIEIACEGVLSGQQGSDDFFADVFGPVDARFIIHGPGIA